MKMDRFGQDPRGGINIIESDNTSQLHLADGLVNNYVTSLLESNGKLYVGTLGGISTWNGSSFDNGYAQRSLFSNQTMDWL